MRSESRLPFRPVDVRAESAVILLLLVLLSAGCGFGDGVSERDRADARAYVEAAKHFSKRTPALLQAAEQRTARTFYECTLVRLGEPDLPPQSALAGISRIAYYQALLPAYRPYALRLKSIHAHDATLRDIAQAAVDLSHRYGAVRAARPDYCHTLRAWQAAGWKNDFSVMRAIGLSERTFDMNGSPRASRLRRAEEIIAASGERLRELGVAEDDVTSFLLVTDVFAASRGGYTEIARLSRD